MKRKKKKIRTFLELLILFFVLLTLNQFIQNQFNPSGMNSTPSIPFDAYEGVKKYTTVIHDELAKYGLEEYTLTVVALMQQESKGMGGDPMQSSESAGLAPNSITDPAKSITYGVKHFKRIIEYGTKKNVDFSTIIQSYNMGMGYITFVANAGGKHSEVLAKEFSMIQVEKNPTLYNCGGNKDNFRYPYCYGDFTYSEKVASNIDALSDSIPTLVNEDQKGVAF